MSRDSVKVIERYRVSDGFGSVEISIARNENSHVYRIHYPNPVIKGFNIILSIVREILDRGIDIDDRGKAQKFISGRVEKLYRKAIGKRGDRETLAILERAVMREIYGYGLLNPVFHDDLVEDIHLSTRSMYVWVRGYDMMRIHIPGIELSSDYISRILMKIYYTANISLSLSTPIVDGSIVDMGARVHAVHYSIDRESHVVVRKQKAKPLLAHDLVRLGMAPPEVFAYLWHVANSKGSIIIIGEIASGKTTLLNAVASMLDPNTKIVVIEETRELNIQHPNVTYMSLEHQQGGRLGLFDLVKASLRQRPDYIIVGEIRGEEAYALFQAISLGHGGLTTIHAESPQSLFKRLSTKPFNIPPYMLGEIYSIVQVAKFRERERVYRKIVSVSDLVSIDPSTIEPELETVYRIGGSLDLARSHSIERIHEKRLIEPERQIEAIRRKTDEIRRMAEKTMEVETHD